MLRAVRGSIPLHALLDATEHAAGAALPLTALQAVWTAAPGDLRYIDGIRHVNGLLLIAALTWLATGVIAGLANGVIAVHPATVDDNLQARRIQTQAKVFSRSAMVLVVIGGAAMVIDTTETRMKVRALVSGASAGKAFDLGCRVRESLLTFMAREHPDYLPRL